MSVEDTTMKAFLIGKESNEHLSVQILRRSYSSEDYWDGWVSVSVELAVGGFHGAFNACFRAEDFVSFREQLAQLYSFASQVARFETLEEQLTIHMKGDKLGHFSAKCEALDELGSGNRLSFSLSFDQTEIPKMLDELDNVIKEFPVYRKP